MVLYFDGGIKSAAEKNEKMPLCSAQTHTVFEAFPACQSVIKHLYLRPKYTHGLPASSENTENCDRSVTVRAGLACGAAHLL